MRKLKPLKKFLTLGIILMTLMMFIGQVQGFKYPNKKSKYFQLTDQYITGLSWAENTTHFSCAWGLSNPLSIKIGIINKQDVVVDQELQWEVLRTVDIPNGTYDYISPEKPAILMLENGTILLMLKLTETDGFFSNNSLFLTRSDDQGATWAIPQGNDMVGEPNLIIKGNPFLITLENDSIVAFWERKDNSLGDPYLLEYRISDDDGETWNSKNILFNGSIDYITADYKPDNSPFLTLFFNDNRPAEFSTFGPFLLDLSNNASNWNETSSLIRLNNDTQSINSIGYDIVAFPNQIFMHCSYTNIYFSDLENQVYSDYFEVQFETIGLHSGKSLEKISESASLYFYQENSSIYYLYLSNFDWKSFDSQNDELIIFIVIIAVIIGGQILIFSYRKHKKSKKARPPQGDDDSVVDSDDENDNLLKKKVSKSDGDKTENEKNIKNNSRDDKQKESEETEDVSEDKKEKETT